MILMIQTRLMDGVIGCDNGKINNPTWLLTVSIRKTSRFLFWQKIYSIDVKRAFGSGSKLSTTLVFTFQIETQTGKISPQLIFFKCNYSKKMLTIFELFKLHRFLTCMNTIHTMFSSDVGGGYWRWCMFVIIWRCWWPILSLKSHQNNASVTKIEKLSLS